MKAPNGWFSAGTALVQFTLMLVVRAVVKFAFERRAIRVGGF